MNHRTIPIIHVKRAKKPSRQRMHLVYRVWYGDRIVYVGRANSALSNTLRRHFFKTKYMQTVFLDIERVTKIEYQRHYTYSDTRVYQLYYIHKFFPTTQMHMDAYADGVSFRLPVVKWQPYRPGAFDQWKAEARLIKEGKAAKAKELRLYYSRLLTQEKQNLKEVRAEAKFDQQKQKILEEIKQRIKAEEK